jgi:hypothetical protein
VPGDLDLDPELFLRTSGSWLATITRSQVSTSVANLAASPLLSALR